MIVRLVMEADAFKFGVSDREIPGFPHAFESVQSVAEEIASPAPAVLLDADDKSGVVRLDRRKAVRLARMILAMSKEIP